MEMIMVNSKHNIPIVANFRTIPLHQWPKEFFDNNSNQVFEPGHFLCPNVDELELDGNRLSQKSTHISLEVYKWGARLEPNWNQTAIQKKLTNIEWAWVLKINISIIRI